MARYRMDFCVFKELVSVLNSQGSLDNHVFPLLVETTTAVNRRVVRIVCSDVAPTLPGETTLGDGDVIAIDVNCLSCSEYCFVTQWLPYIEVALETLCPTTDEAVVDIHFILRHTGCSCGPTTCPCA